MKRKMIARLIDEAGQALDHIHGAMPLGDDGTPKGEMLVTEDDIRAMQTCLCVLSDVVAGLPVTNGMDLATKIVTLHCVIKADNSQLADLLRSCGEGHAEGNAPASDEGGE